MLVYDNKLSEYRAVHPPDVGDRILAAALADEINLRSLGIPDGTDIVRRMERQLRQAGTIRMTHEDIGIPIQPGAVLQTVASDQDDLASVRRNNRRRKEFRCKRVVINFQISIFDLLETTVTLSILSKR